jgi:hypothetical protein
MSQITCATDFGICVDSALLRDFYTDKEVVIERWGDQRARKF